MMDWRLWLIAVVGGALVMSGIMALVALVAWMVIVP